MSDDAPTLAALGVIAFVIADVTHEALGHGIAALAVGAKPVILTTAYLGTSGVTSRWIPAAGGIANAAMGLLAWALLRFWRRTGPHARLFLALILAFNLLFASAYPAYSGIALFGDWASVIAGLSPQWLWRVLLIAGSVAGYYFSLWIIAWVVAPFGGAERLKRMTFISFIAALIVAAGGGALNPSGWRTMFTAAIPAAGAAFGLAQIDHFAHVDDEDTVAEVITRSPAWVGAGVVMSAFFVGVLGPGIRFGS